MRRARKREEARVRRRLVKLKLETSLPLREAPSLAVVLPVHNGMPHVEKSVRSILDQSLGDFEFIIGDDGSDDGTTAVLARLADEDGRIRLLRRKRKSGLAAAANWVVSHARAPLVAISHADDIAHPDRLRRQVEIFRDRPDAVLVGALSTGIDADGRIVHPPNLWRVAFPTAFAPMTHSSIMFRRAGFDQLGGYRTRTDYWEDLDLYWRLYRLGRILIIPEALACYRYSAASARERGQAEGLEQSLEKMYRSAELYRQHRDYEPLLSGSNGNLAGVRIHPRIFVARSWMRVWSGQRAILFGPMLRRARFGFDVDSVLSFAFMAWASISPKSLRFVLQVTTRIRNRIALPIIGRAAFVEWRPCAPDWPEGADAAAPCLCAGKNSLIRDP
jgi:glycosyltransferase involved in cell wall biosynthesis